MAAMDGGLAWYVVHTQPRREMLVASLLEDRLHLAVFLPEIVQSTRGQKRKAPLFPGYVFVEADFAVTAPTAINTLPGVFRLVTTGERPQAVPAQEIARLREQLAQWNAQGGLPQHSFTPGQEVTIKGGPFQGLAAVFVGPMRPAQRVRVLLHFLGALSQVELPVSELETTTAAAARRPRRTRGRGRSIKPL